jgi:hypothetical protein
MESVDYHNDHAEDIRRLVEVSKQIIIKDADSIYRSQGVGLVTAVSQRSNHRREEVADGPCNVNLRLSVSIFARNWEGKLETYRV